MDRQHHGNLAHSHPKLQIQKREQNFRLLFDSSTHFLSKLEIFTVTVLSQNYHWTDGFFVKNHPLKEAEKQYKFCFRVNGAQRGQGVE